jgi:penicillin amidase
VIITLLLVAILVAGGFIYLQQLKPQYSGVLVLEGLHQKVEVYFDPYAVPHIYARNEADAYFALGYVHPGTPFPDGNHAADRRRANG